MDLFASELPWEWSAQRTLYNQLICNRSVGVV